MSQKSPFEIRLDVFALAKDFMDKQYEAQIKSLEALQKVTNVTQMQIEKAYKMYTPEELQKQAEQFYSQFVTNKEL